MNNFTKSMRERQMKGKNQFGVNMVGLIIWMVLAVVIMGGVVALFASTSQQTAIGAEQNQQQQSILNALNRTSRDVAASNPIRYATDTEIVLDVTTADGSVDRRRYVLDKAEKEVWEYSKRLENRGDTYDHNNLPNEWSNLQRAAKTVYDVDTDATSFLKYYDNSGALMASTIIGSKDIEAIARVDISLTADVSNKGKVSLSTSAVPRSTTNLGAQAEPILAPCPAFTATLNDDSVVLRWDKASDDTTSYEITRNGVTIQPTTPVTDPTKLKYSYTDTPGASSTVLNYMLKVVSPAGISNCIDSVRSIVIAPGATQLNAGLLPLTTVDGAGNPVSTNWSNAAEGTKVELKWQKVEIATGYVIYKQRLDSNGAPVGARITAATLEEYPYVDLNASTKAADELSHTLDAGWDEHWEWSIKVLSRSGDNEQTPEMRTLSYPAPVTDVSISAVPLSGAGAVSAADQSAGKGNNRITWTYTAGMEARGFDIYRSVIDQPATNFPAGFTKIGSVNAGISEFFDRNAEFGSTYGYYVVAKNKSGFANAYASQRVQQLQFPPDPVLTAVGSTGSRDLNDGTNRVMWSAAKSATGYHVFRTNIATGAQTCMTGTNCATNSGTLSAPATSFDDSSSVITPATRFRYVAYSYNATGVSPSLAAAVTLTQRPAVPTVTVTTAPTTTSNTTVMGWNANAGSWCVSGTYTGASGSTACQYEQKQYNNAGASKYTDDAYASSYSWTNQEWGRHYTYSVRSRNAAIYNGGWSDTSAKPASNTYPSPFSVNIWLGDADATNKHRINYDSKKEVGGWGNVRQTGYTTWSWGAMTGTKSVAINRVADSNQDINTNSALLLPTVATAVGALNDDSNGNVGTIDSGMWSYVASPGTRYHYVATSTALENTLTRTVTTGYAYTPADVPSVGAVQIVCAGPGNGDTTGTLDHPGQVIAARTAYMAPASRYGYYDQTEIEKLYEPAKTGGLKSNGWVTVGKGNNANNVLSDSNGTGYFRDIENGFTFLNSAAGRTDSAVLSRFTVHVIYTFDKCPAAGQTMQEPSDACYGTAYSGCMTLNSTDRPRWDSN